MRSIASWGISISLHSLDSGAKVIGMRKSPARSYLLCDGPCNRQWYTDKFGVLREGDGLYMGSDHYTITRWPSGELVGYWDER
jgi:hypothetical protein